VGGNTLHIAAVVLLYSPSGRPPTAMQVTPNAVAALKVLSREAACKEVFSKCNAFVKKRLFWIFREL